MSKHKELFTYREIFAVILGLTIANIDYAVSKIEVTVHIFAAIILFIVIAGIKWVMMRIKWTPLKEHDES